MYVRQRTEECIAGLRRERDALNAPAARRSALEFQATKGR
jgi:hypothetical protein